jgi:methylated-DNA-[protein]-cysteine S-methyltransferase
MIYTCTIDTPIGTMTGAAKDEALVGLWFAGQKYYPSETDHWICETDHPVFTTLRRELACYFSGEPGAIHVRLAPSGSPFQEAVWDLLSQIPMGHVTTYGRIAGRIAETRGLASMSAQAVGGAVGHNPISILIPCHRVVGSQGRLTGYAGGLDRKAALLRIERVNLTRIDPGGYAVRA